jgi:hypothetical protein
MKKLLLVPALLFAACGDNLHPDLDQAVGGAADSDSDSADTPVTDAALTASFTASPASCDTYSVAFASAYAYADGTTVANPICHYDFGDGTSGDTCTAVHSYVTGPGNWQAVANVTLTVTDPATGATATYTDIVIPPGNFDIGLTATSDGLSISWNAFAFYVDGTIGGEISIEPADKVIIDDPQVLQSGNGTVRVTEAGTYEVTFHSAIWPGVEGCDLTLHQAVEVTGCSGDGH